MNDLIEKFAKQAFGSTIDTDPILVYEAEKFAELIVRECATAFEAEVNTWKQMDPYQGSIKRQGAGNHSLTINNPFNATNNNNTVTATQSGGVGADKTFNLMFSGATGAGVTINQTNPTTPDQGGMNIQCNPCGSGWSYTKY